jgi:hypothetical protein
MGQAPISPDLEKLAQQLRGSGLAFNRLEAAKKIAKLKASHPQLVLALMRAAAFDKSAEVRKAAAAALKARVHAEIAAGNPGLAEAARAAEAEILKPSIVGIVSFGLSIVSILIIYADLFFISAPAPAGGAPVLDISPLYCVSVLLSLAGIVLGVIGLRQDDRANTFPRLGLLFNGLIVLGTLILTVVIRFTLA